MLRRAIVVVLVCLGPHAIAQSVEEIAVLKARLRALEGRVAELEEMRSGIHRAEDPQSREWYRQELRTIGSNPGTIPSTDRPVAVDSPLRVGQVLQVKWGNGWWGARVLRLLPDGRVGIRYLGWDPSQDVVVARSLLQFDDDAEAKSKQAVAARQARPVNPKRPPPKPMQSTGRPLTEQDSLAAGADVEVLWGNNWWAGKVLAVEDDGDVRITYVGWDSHWDEAVPRSRLRLPDGGTNAK